MKIIKSSIPAFIALGAGGAVSPVAMSAAFANDQAVELTLSTYDSGLRLAVQNALHDKGYYSGPIDGKAGPKTRGAFLKFRADHGIAVAGPDDLKLDDDVVEALFGIRNSGIKKWTDQACLLSKLGQGGEDAQSMCAIGDRLVRLQQEHNPQPTAPLADPAKH